MTIVVGGVTKYLSAYANIDPSGTKYPNGYVSGDPSSSFSYSGPFQCTALVAQYLSLLGASSAINDISNGGNVAANLSSKDPSQFASSNGGALAPQIGSIISFADVVAGVTEPVTAAYPGHVAIVKGITYSDDGKTIVVTLIEDNLTIKSQSTFAVDQTVTLVDVNGLWVPSSRALTSDFSLAVTGWATPK
jgi:surface antigen